MWDEIKHPTLNTFRIYLGFFRKYLKENIKLYCLLLAQNSVIIEICYKGNHFLCLMWEKILNSKYFSRLIGLHLIGQSYTRVPSAHKMQAYFRPHFGVKKCVLWAGKYGINKSFIFSSTLVQHVIHGQKYQNYLY